MAAQGVELLLLVSEEIHTNYSSSCGNMVPDVTTAAVVREIRNPQGHSFRCLYQVLVIKHNLVVRRHFWVPEQTDQRVLKRIIARNTPMHQSSNGLQPASVVQMDGANASAPGCRMG